MRVSQRVRMAVLAVAAVAVPVAWGDVTGSYDGTLALKKPSQLVAASAVLSQTGNSVQGTVALPADLVSLGIRVRGKASAKKLKLRNDPGGIPFKWQARIAIAADSLSGKMMYKGPGRKLAGILMLTPSVGLADGAPCDPVYTQNQTLFVDQVLGLALTECTACHVPGGQAEATRLDVTAGDPLATARSVAQFVDGATPAASRILQKPLQILPHGGGRQLVDPTAEQALRQWVDLVAASGCR